MPWAHRGVLYGVAQFRNDEARLQRKLEHRCKVRISVSPAA